MITPEQWNQIEKQAEQIYNKLELEIIQEIAERIANVGYANTVVLNDIIIAQEMGILYQDIINKVAIYNNASVSQIEDIFETAGANSLKYDDKIYKEAGLNPVPIKQSKSMWKLLEATALKTHNNLRNLTMTTANTSQVQFYNAMNKAYMEVSTGVKSYSQSIIDTIKEISNQGAYIEYPSGQHRSIESAVRTNIITSANQTCGKLQLMRAEELEWDLMELTAHGGARPEHAEWQGKIVSLSGQKGYLSLDDIGYGTATGFKGVNCRHDWRPYYKGSTRTYTDKELKGMANETVKYNGQKISKYNATQIQRKMERQIRQDRKDIAGLQGILTSNNADIELEQVENNFKLISAKLKQKEMVLKDFLNQTELRRDKTKEFTYGINRNLSQKIVQSHKRIEKNKEMLYNDTTELEYSLSYIDLNTKKKMFIPKNAEISNIKDIAGGNSGKILRKAERLEEKYGLNAENWIKRVGKIESNAYVFDIHWEEHTEGIKCNWKIKNYSLKGKDDK